jgi:DNA-binding MurR/RpiR family transcriptional regulator
LNFDQPKVIVDQGDQHMPPKTLAEPKRQRPAAASLENRIRDVYEQLPSSERKIADLILEFPGEIAAYAATELAELAGGSKAAVTRLIHRLEYSSFEEARRASRDAQSWGSPLYLMPREPAQKGFAGRIQTHIDQDTKNVAQTMERLSPDRFEEIVNAIWRARRVFVLGYRNSHYLAGYLRLQLMLARPDVHLLSAAGETLAEFLADLDKNDLLIVIGLRRRVPEVSRTIGAAADNGAKVLFVADANARLQKAATWTLPCAVQGHDVFDRYAGAVSLLHFLSVSLMSRSGKRGRERLKMIEQLQEDLHEFG